MSTYVIGDIQGCFDSFLALLDQIDFCEDRDVLWSCGDLINRGPKSLEILQWAYERRDNFRIILGNHELNLLSCYFGLSRPKMGDTIEPILQAPAASELLEWVRSWPLLHQESVSGFFITMVHGGLLPEWNLSQAKALALEVEGVLQGPKAQVLLKEGRENYSSFWNESLQGICRWATVLKGMTQIRFLTPENEMKLKIKTAPQEADPNLVPWFKRYAQLGSQDKILFGHWATLGLFPHWEDGFVGLDSGCVWGQALSCLRLEDQKIFQVKAVEKPAKYFGD